MRCPIQAAPFYAVELSPSMLNTQGGPRHNARAQIVRPDGSPIPRLYSAGELGSIYSYLYQGTGNIGECLALAVSQGVTPPRSSPGVDNVRMLRWSGGYNRASVKAVEVMTMRRHG